VELTDDAVDAGLRALEELLADPRCLPHVAAYPGLTGVLLELLAQADSSSQVRRVSPALAAAPALPVVGA